MTVNDGRSNRLKRTSIDDPSDSRPCALCFVANGRDEAGTYSHVLISFCMPAPWHWTLSGPIHASEGRKE
jgi:hypothetical protein